MMQVSRRTIVLDGLLTVFAGTCCSSHAGAQQSVAGEHGGCWVPSAAAGSYFSAAGDAYSYTSGNEQMEPRSGNPSLDRALAQSLAKLTHLFGVLPGFAYYNDAGAPNARATPAQMLNKTDGTVLMGLEFLKMLLAMPVRPDAAVVAVCAHEYGHILSYKNGMIQQLRTNSNEPFRAEQFADYMAGYYAGSRKRENAAYPAAVFATTQHHFGGGDHGSPEQRGSAVQTGFMAAYSQRLSATQAANAALQYSLAQNL